jgi:hypothetical protein
MLFNQPSHPICGETMPVFFQFMITGLSLSLISCTTIHPQTLSAWEGRQLWELEQHQAWGVPDEKISLSDGSIAYVYVQQSATLSHSVYSGHSLVQTFQCKHTFISDGTTILRFRYRGRCEADESMLPESPAALKDPIQAQPPASE